MTRGWGTNTLHAAGCIQNNDSESTLNTNLKNIWLLKENNTLDRKGKTRTPNKLSINFQPPPPSSACTVGKTSRTGRTAGAPRKHGKHSPPVFPETKGRPLLRRLRSQPSPAPVRHLRTGLAPAQHTPCTLGPGPSGFLTAAAPQGLATPSWQGTALPSGTICNGGAAGHFPPSPRQGHGWRGSQSSAELQMWPFSPKDSFRA